jgi:hypothetical protein
MAGNNDRPRNQRTETPNEVNPKGHILVRTERTADRGKWDIRVSQIH